MDEAVAAAWRLLPGYLTGHIVLSAAALALGLAVSLPLILAAARWPRVRWPVLAVASLIQTIPSLALLALFYPLLLALSALAKVTVGHGFAALGFLPSLLALTLYSILPILRNGVTGLTGIDPLVVEAADAVGMTPRQKLFQVQAPLAAPVDMAGVRTAAVWTIGAATLSTAVGWTSLGNYIFEGLQTENSVLVLFGCVAAAALALVTDQLLGLIETGLSRRSGGRALVGLAGLAVGLGLALAPLALSAGRPAAYVLGAKDFSEQYILADLMADRLHRLGARTELRQGLGSVIAFRALASNDLDAYVDYSGTVWANVLDHKDTPPRRVLLDRMTRELHDRYGVVVFGSLGFENAYVLAMKRAQAARLGVTSLADLAPRAPGLTLGADTEFLARPEWRAIQAAYGLHFKAEKTYEPTFMYRAVMDGEVDAISAFSSDGRIAADDLVALGDPKGAIPPYDAVILIAPKRAGDARLRRALTPLLGAIPVETMRAANLSVDRDRDKLTPEQAARDLGRRTGR